MLVPELLVTNRFQAATRGCDLFGRIKRIFDWVEYNYRDVRIFEYANTNRIVWLSNSSIRESNSWNSIITRIFPTRAWKWTSSSKRQHLAVNRSNDKPRSSLLDERSLVGASSEFAVWLAHSERVYWSEWAHSRVNKRALCIISRQTHRRRTACVTEKDFRRWWNSNLHKLIY